MEATSRRYHRFQVVSEVDRVRDFLSVELACNDSVVDILTAYETEADAELSAAISNASRTVLWALLQSLLRGEERRQFAVDRGCLSTIAQVLIDLIEDELWRRRKADSSTLAVSGSAKK